MTRYAVRLTKLAEADLIDISQHLAEQNGPVRARRQISRIRGSVKLLEFMPQRFAEHADFGTGRRVLASGPWRIAYRITPNAVFVLRILHERRRPEIT